MAYDLEELTVDSARRIVGNTAFSPEQWGAWLRMWWNAEESRQRKTQIRRRMDYYDGNQLPYLSDLVRTTYEDAEALSMQLEFTNIVRMIVDRLSVIYNAGVRRDLTGPDVTDSERELWNWIQRKGRLDRVMDTVNRYVNLIGTALVMVRMTEEGICFDILTPDIVDIIPRPDNPTEAMSISYSVSDGDDYLRITADERQRHLTYHYWDADTHFTFDTDGIVDDAHNPERINPYGVLPFARFTSGLPMDSYFSDSGEDMVTAQDMVNLKLAELNHLLKMQSFSVPVLIGYEPDRDEKIVISPGRPVVIPRSDREEQPAEFRFETPDPNIQTLMDEIDNKIIRLARTYGLSDSDFRLTGNAQSGLALRIQGRHLENRFNRELPYYEDGEQETFEIVRRVWNYHQPTLPAGHPFSNTRFADTTKLSVTIYPPSIHKDPDENQKWWEFLFSAGLASKIEFFMKEMNMTEEEAKAHLQHVQELQAEE